MIKELPTPQKHKYLIREDQLVNKFKLKGNLVSMEITIEGWLIIITEE